MMVFVDETGSDNRDSMRKFGYALRGQRATSRRLMCRGKRVNSVAAMDMNGVICVDSTTDSVVMCFVTFWSVLFCLNYSHSMVSILEALYFLTMHLYIMYHMQLASFRVLVH